jgi:hypothetical protein
MIECESGADEHNLASVNGGAVTVGDLLGLDYHGTDYVLSYLQTLHDRSVYWGDEGLNTSGWSELKSMIAQFELNPDKSVLETIESHLREVVQDDQNTY